jgi:hypothetical protein
MRQLLTKDAMIKRHVTKPEMEKVAKMYRSPADAAAALGIAVGTVSRLLKRYEITPRWKKGYGAGYAR